MTKEEKVDAIIDIMTRLYEIEARLKNVITAFEELSIKVNQNSEKI